MLTEDDIKIEGLDTLGNIEDLDLSVEFCVTSLQDARNESNKEDANDPLMLDSIDEEVGMEFCVYC